MADAEEFGADAFRAARVTDAARAVFAAAPVLCEEPQWSSWERFRRAVGRGLVEA